MNFFEDPQQSQPQNQGMFSGEVQQPNKVQEAQGFLRSMKPENAEALLVAGLSLIQGNDAGTAGLQALGHRNQILERKRINQRTANIDKRNEDRYQTQLGIQKQAIERTNSLDKRNEERYQTQLKLQNQAMQRRLSLDEIESERYSDTVSHRNAQAAAAEARHKELLDFRISQQADLNRYRNRPIHESKPKQKDKEIQSLIRQGMNRDKAENLAYGRERYELNPNTGVMLYQNDVTGENREIPLANMIGEPRPSPEPGQTLWDYSEHGTGLASALQSAVDVPLAMAGYTPHQATQQARQGLKTEQGRLRKALSVSPKFPVYEMQAIDREINLEPKVFDDPKLMRERMISLNRSLKLKVSQYKRMAEDRSLPEDERKALAVGAAHVQNFLDVLGVPEGASMGEWSEAKERRYQELLEKQGSPRR